MGTLPINRADLLVAANLYWLLTEGGETKGN